MKSEKNKKSVDDQKNLEFSRSLNLSFGVNDYTSPIIPIDSPLNENIPQQRTPLPIFRLFIVSLVQLVEGVVLCQLLPYMPFFVEYLIDADPEDPRISSYNGFLVGSYALSQFCTSYLWGMASDKWGRRPIILFGILVNSIFTLLFGISKNITMAFVFRICTGLFNSNVGIIKTYLREILDKSNQAKGFSLITMSFSFGLLVGPLIGGILYDITDKGFFSDNPAFLPCLVFSILSILTFIFSYFYLDETKNNVNTENFSDVEIEQNDVENNVIVEDQNNNSKSKNIFKYFLHNIDFIGSSLMYGLVALYSIIFQTSFPLWAKILRSNDGWEWDPKKISYVQSSGSIGNILFQIFFFHRLVNKFGLLLIYRIAWILPILNLFFWPFMIKAKTLLLQYFSVILYIEIASMTSAILFTVPFIIISNSVERKFLGTGNGIAQSFTCLLRGIGPSISGLIFGWSVENEKKLNSKSIHNPFLNRNLIFYIAALIGLVSLFVSLMISNKHKRLLPKENKNISKIKI